MTMYRAMQQGARQASSGTLHSSLHSSRTLLRSVRGSDWSNAARSRRVWGAPSDRMGPRAVQTRAIASVTPQAPQSSKLSEQAPSISPGEVHLWWLHPAKAASGAMLQRCGELLTPEELRHCRASSNPMVVKERLLVRAFVRSVLSQYVTASPQALVFSRNEHGKPDLVWPGGTAEGHTLHFNLTHTTGIIGLAVSAGALVGIDVEELGRKAWDPLRLARRRFTEQEFQDLQAAPEGPPRDTHFIKLWTLKEAYVKALGRGMSAPPGLRSFSFRLGAGSAQRHGEQQQNGAAQHAEQAQAPQRGWKGGCNDNTPSIAPATLCAVDQQAAREQRAEPFANGVQLAATPLPWHTHCSGSSDCGSSSCGDCSSRSSDSNVFEFGRSGDSCTIAFDRSSEAMAYESRQWRFLLLRPSAVHIAALCIEQLEAAEAGGNAGVRVAAFEGMPCGDCVPIELPVLGRGGTM